MTTKQILLQTIRVATKFMNKVETGRARSKETYRELKELKQIALDKLNELGEEK